MRAGPTGEQARATVAAFYLPQFHPIPENDAWWGEGFTEWSNVGRARPQFHGHRQPQVPGPLGWYDLRDPDVHFQQHELAAQFGVGAFCYYVYWFGGKRLLERPLEVVLEQQELPTRYFLCWANENWTRTWDGAETEVLVGQTHSPEHDARIVDDLAPHLSDPRYLRVDGKPLLLVYRSTILDDPMRTTDAIRARAHALGLGELHLAMVQSFGAWDPRGLGFDSAVEFPPHGAGMWLNVLQPGEEETPALLEPEQAAGTLLSYPRTLEWALSKPVPDFRWYRGVMPSWDNTPRRQERGTVFVDDSPELFQTWLERALHHTYLNNEPRDWLVFVNAWNEWAEGAYLEPDVDRGTARLEAVARALANTDALAGAVARSHAAEGADDALLEVARAYYRSSVVLGREALVSWRPP
ncbi:MAG: glycoside hydrolase family 99-like domain-containing protein [Mycobacteriales bacterium]